MKMKNLKWVLMLSIALVSCQKKAYIQTIPKEASMVVSANIANIATEADLKNTSLMQMVNTYVGMITASDAKQQIQSYVESPEKMGVDFMSPFYFFQAGDFVGVTMRIADEGDMEDFLEMLSTQGIAKKQGETDGVKTALLMDDLVMAYNDDTCLLLGKVEGGQDTRHAAIELMQQAEEESFVATEAYEKMQKKGKGDLVAYSNGSALSKTMLEDVKSFLPAGVRPTDVEIVSAYSFENGKAVLGMEINGKSKEIQKLLKDGNENFHKIEGRYIKAPQENFAVWACAGVKGPWLLEQLKQETHTKQLLLLLERAIDIEQIIRNVDGDVAITLPKSILGADNLEQMDYMLTAHVQNTDFLKDVDYWQKTMKDYGMTMSKSKGNDFILKAGENTLNWGVDDEDVYFSSANMFAANAVSQRSDLLSAYEKQIKKSQIFLYVNLDMLFASYRNASVPYIDNAIRQLKSLILQSESSNSVELTIELKDSSVNFLKALLQ